MTLSFLCVVSSEDISRHINWHDFYLGNAAHSIAENMRPQLKMSGMFVNDGDVPGEVRSMGRQLNICLITALSITLLKKRTNFSRLKQTFLIFLSSKFDRVARRNVKLRYTFRRTDVQRVSRPEESLSVRIQNNVCRCVWWAVQVYHNISQCSGLVTFAECANLYAWLYIFLSYAVNRYSYTVFTLYFPDIKHYTHNLLIISLYLCLVCTSLYHAFWQFF